MRRTARTVLSLSLSLPCCCCAGLFVRQHAIIKFGGPRKKWPAAHTTASGEFHAICCCGIAISDAECVLNYLHQWKSGRFFPGACDMGPKRLTKVMTVFQCILTFDTLQLKKLFLLSKRYDIRKIHLNPFFKSVHANWCCSTVFSPPILLKQVPRIEIRNRISRKWRAPSSNMIAMSTSTLEKKRMWQAHEKLEPQYKDNIFA